jgi:hypothetical protein
MITTRSTAPLAAAAIFALAAAGCSPIVVTPGTTSAAAVYSGGSLYGAEDASLDKVWNGVQGAVKELQFKETFSEKDVFTGRLYANRADGTGVKFYLKKRDEKLTQIEIRVGVFGNPAESRELYDKVRAHMNDPMPGAAPAPAPAPVPSKPTK